MTDLIIGTFPIRPEFGLDALQSLTLMHVCLSTDLLTFLEGQSHRLNSVHLIDCSADMHGYQCINWADFFAGIRRASPVLQEFVVLNTSVIPLTREEEFGYTPDEDSEIESHEVRTVREELKADSKRRLFPHIYIDEKYGTAYKDEDRNLEMFMRGADQREYDALMGLVANNRTRCGLAPEYTLPSKLIHVMRVQRLTAALAKQQVQRRLEKIRDRRRSTEPFQMSDD